MTDAVIQRLVERLLPDVIGELPGDGEQIALKMVPDGALHVCVRTLIGHPLEVLLDRRDHCFANLFTALLRRPHVEVVDHEREETLGTVLVRVAPPEATHQILLIRQLYSSHAGCLSSDRRG